MGVLQLGFGLFQIAAIAFGVTFFAVMFWGSIRIVEADNSHNKFSSALAWGGVHILVSFMLGWSEVFGLIGMAAWLVFMLRLLVDFYGMSLLKSLLAIIIANGTPYVIGPVLGRIFLGSEVGALVFLFGFPAVTIIVWQTAATRERIALRALDNDAPRRRKPDVETESAPTPASPRTATPAPPPPRVRDATGPSPVIAAPVIAPPPLVVPPVIAPQPMPVPVAAAAGVPSPFAAPPPASVASAGGPPVAAPIAAATLPPPFTARPAPPPLPIAPGATPVARPQAAPPMVPGASPVPPRSAGPPAPLVVQPAPMAVAVAAPAVRPNAAPTEASDEPSGPVGEPTFLR